MAQSEHLPIYKAAYDLCLYVEQVVYGFSRYHKYSLGADLRDGSRRALKLVVRANSRRDQVPVLLELREEVEQLKVVEIDAVRLRGAHAVRNTVTFTTDAIRFLSRRERSGEGIRCSP